MQNLVKLNFLDVVMFVKKVVKFGVIGVVFCGCANFSVTPVLDRSENVCKIRAMAINMSKRDLKFVPKNVKIESSDMKFTLAFSDFSMIDDGVSVMRFAMPNLDGILKNIKDDKRTVSANLSFFANGQMLSFFSQCVIDADNPRKFLDDCKGKIARNLENQINLACENGRL
jgi:lipoprotein